MAPEQAARRGALGPADPERIERDYGFAEWEPPDAGGDTKAHNFGGGSAGRSLEGWDEDYTRQMESWLASPSLPEPFCLVFSLVNPHDVLGFPTPTYPAATRCEEFRGLGVPAAGEPGGGPAREARRAGALAAGHGQLPRPAPRPQAKQDYVDFYAYLHRVVDRHIGRLLRALGPPEDEASLRSRTIVIRTSDHGEMGLSHGGLRQKIFNAYEETIRVPLVVSNPRLFPQPRGATRWSRCSTSCPPCSASPVPGTGPRASTARTSRR